MADTEGPLEARDQVGQPIQSVDRALTLLSEFMHKASLTVSEASQLLGVSKSTAHRLLAMLQLHGYVRQDDRSKAYLSGPALIQVGLAAFTKLDIRAVAQPSLDSLLDVTGETAHLMILEDTRVLFVDGRESRHPLRVGLRVGASELAHRTASGRSILSNLSEAELERYWSRASADPQMPRNMTWDHLVSELAAVRERGWAVNDLNSDEGVRAVGASVAWSGAGAHLRAAIAVAGPTARMPLDRLPILGAEVMREAAMVAGRVSRFESRRAQPPKLVSGETRG